MDASVEILISVFASVTFGSVFMVVLVSKPLTNVRRAFIFYLAAMLLWSVSSWVIFAEWGDITYWFRILSGGAVTSMVGLFFFVQNLFARRRPWAPLVFWYGMVASILAVFTPLAVKNAYLEQGHIVYDFNLSFVLMAGPGYILTVFNMFELVQGYRETKSERQRVRLRYLITAIGIILSVSLVNWTELGKYPIDIAANGVAAVLIAYAILRHALLDIRVFMRTGLLYSLITVITGAIYFLLFSFALQVFESYTGERLFAVSIVVAIITSSLLTPLREKTQAWIDRLFNRTRYDASLMMERLSVTTATLMEVDDIADIILEEIITTMKVEHISLFVKYEMQDVFRLVSYRGSPIHSTFDIRANHPIVKWLADNNQVLTLNELSINPVFKSLWGIERQLIGDRKIELFISLFAGQELVGFFAIGQKLSAQPYNQDDVRILVTAANQTAMAVKNARLFNQLQETFVQTVVSLANAIDVRDTYTSDHSQRIARLASETAKAMGCSDDVAQEIYWGGLLHDIGKIGIPDAILLKPGPLDEDEWTVIRKHPDIGADLIQPISQLAHVAPIIRYSHERFDGNGYPQGLTGEEIPIGARIVAVVDAFSAMMDQRVYKNANSLQETILEIKRNSGTQFDPKAVQAFLKVVADYRGENSPGLLYPPAPERM